MPYSDAFSGNIESGFEKLQDKVPVHIAQRVSTITSALDNLINIETLYNQAEVQAVERVIEKSAQQYAQPVSSNQDIDSIRQNIDSIYEGV